MSNQKKQAEKAKKLSRDEKARREAKLKEDMKHPDVLDNIFVPVLYATLSHAVMH
jgi:hypothetical protein